MLLEGKIKSNQSELVEGWYGNAKPKVQKILGGDGAIDEATLMVDFEELKRG